MIIVGAIWGLLLATRLLRGEEDAGRWELLLAGRTTRRPATVQGTRRAGGRAGRPVDGRPRRSPCGPARRPTSASRSPRRCSTRPPETASAAMFLAVGALAGSWPGPAGRPTGSPPPCSRSSYLIRMIADGVSGLGWLRWASPLGLGREPAPAHRVAVAGPGADRAAHGGRGVRARSWLPDAGTSGRACSTAGGRPGRACGCSATPHCSPSASSSGSAVSWIAGLAALAGRLRGGRPDRRGGERGRCRDPAVGQPAGWRRRPVRPRRGSATSSCSWAHWWPSPPPVRSRPCAPRKPTATSTTCWPGPSAAGRGRPAGSGSPSVWSCSPA